MKKLILLFILMTSICKSEPIKILFIGNSLTFFNDMPKMFSSICESAGKEVYVKRWTEPGTSLRYFSRDSYCLANIETEQWDYVILQSDDITAFPDLFHYEINAIQRLKDVILANCPTTKIIYEMIWGIEGGVDVPGEQYYTFEEYINKIYSGTLYISEKMSLETAPVGWAWKHALSEKPDTDLFTVDRAHPTLRGSYLAACVFYSTIFCEPIENEYINTLDKPEAEFFQRIASETVMNDIDLWRNVTDNEEPIILPTAYKLNQNYPNPFNPTTMITFELPAGNNHHVKLSVYDVLGNLIEELCNTSLASGIHTFTWRAANNASGVYFYTLNADGYQITRKMNLTK